VRDHPLGNIIEFHGLTSNPIDLGLTWRECTSCLYRIFESPIKLLHISFGNPEIFRLELECCLKIKKTGTK
jgi:hypothetical protein